MKRHIDYSRAHNDEWPKWLLDENWSWIGEYTDESTYNGFYRDGRVQTNWDGDYYAPNRCHYSEITADEAHAILAEWKAEREWKAKDDPSVRCFEWNVDKHQLDPHRWNWCRLLRIEGERCTKVIKDDGSISGAGCEWPMESEEFKHWREFPPSEWDERVAKLRGPSVVPWDTDTFPKDRPVWVRHKQCTTGRLDTIRTVTADGATIVCQGHKTWQVLLDEYEQRDGQPCGVEIGKDTCHE